VIVAENVLAPMSGENIVEAVVVVVSNTNTVRPASLEKSGLPSDIGKGAVTPW